MSTELKAVNTMLRSIGQVPVQDISDSPISDSRIALEILREYTDELQSEGYDFNTTEALKLSPNSDGEIFVPINTHRVRPTESHPRVTIRQSKLYDLDNQTFIFTGPIKVDTQFCVPYPELPPTLQRYVVIRASRVFGNRVVGAGELNAYGQEDEARARIMWLNAVSEDMALNVLSSSSHHRPSTFTSNSVINRL